MYRSLPRPEQVYTLFKELKSIAIRALKEGKSEAEVLMLLRRRLRKETAPAVAAVVKRVKQPVLRTTPYFTKRLFSLQGTRRERLVSGTRKRLQCLAKVLPPSRIPCRRTRKNR
jgi:hypothetical protein